MRSKFICLIVLVAVLTVSNQIFAQCGGGHNHNGNSSSTNHQNHNSGTSNINHQNHPNGLTSIKVYGKCEMCKVRIEKAALSVKGVKWASWDVNSKILQIDMRTGVDVANVYKAIAKAGHDTAEFKAVDKLYDALPDCCKYRNVDKDS